MKTFIGALHVISAASSLSVRTMKTKEISLISRREVAWPQQLFEITECNTFVLKGFHEPSGHET